MVSKTNKEQPKRSETLVEKEEELLQPGHRGERNSASSKVVVAEYFATHLDSIEIYFSEKYAKEVAKGLLDPEEAQEDLLESVRREREFVQMVIEAYHRWSEEEDPIVLWDIDDSVGKYNYTEDGMIWRFRISIITLFAYLQEKYPGIRNGIISNRAGLESQLDRAEYLNGISNYIDRKYLYSVRDSSMSHKQEMLYEDEIYRDLGVYPTVDHIRKLQIMRQLHDARVNAKIIDDNPVAKSMKQDGVFLGNVMAQ